MDRYGNDWVSGTPYTWTPTLNSARNQFSPSGACSSGIQYDSDGNLLCDTFHTYTWSASNKLLQVDSNPRTVYDAFDRPVEQNGYEYLQVPGLEKYRMVFTGQNSVDALVPLMGGAQAQFFQGVLNEYLHAPDWTGAYHIGSSALSQTLLIQADYAPYGATMFSAQAIGFDDSFTTAAPDEYQTPNRQLHPVQGRWIQPDPAGLSAVNPSDPQAWNRYAYARNNPLKYNDPTGLDCVYLNDSGTGVEKGGVDQHSSRKECGKTQGYWVDGSVTNVSVGGDAQTISLTGTTNGTDNNMQASYQQHTTVAVGQYYDTFANPAGHIAFGIGNGPRYGLNPRSDWQFMKYAISRRMQGKVGGGPGVPGAVKLQVGGELVGTGRIPVTGMQAQIVLDGIDQGYQNPPSYDVGGGLNTCDCASWPQQVLDDAGINSGPSTQDPGRLINQINSLYPPQQ